jgi:glycosyltransferase involved in cell wall biosynthesis
MRVLWFAPTSSQYDKGSHYYHGGGWIESLEQTFRDHAGEKEKLGICFFHNTDDQKRERGNVTYYPVRSNKKGDIGKLLDNWSCKIESGVYINHFKEVINDFQPDVIQVFGTENSFAEIQQHTNIPVVIHLQGILNPYNNAFYPPGINRYDVLTYLPYLKNHLLGNSLLFDKKRFEKSAERELGYFKAANYLIGRTCWDKMIATRLAPQARYYHVDEILRSSFYESNPWTPVQHDRLQIISTISSTIYKGLDVILKTAHLLKSLGVDFDWKIVGLYGQHKMVGFFERSLKKRFKDCNVSFLGIFSEKELIKLLQGSDMFVHPSYIDNSPNSLCEAQMLGMPVISCDVGGTSTLIKNHETGILVPANGTYELAHAVMSLANDKKKSAQLGAQARVHAMERHNRARTFAILMTVYQTIYKG